MKQNRKLRTAIISAVLLVTIGVASAFTYHSFKKAPRTDWTNYYWYNASGTYLRQNLVDDEINLTGFDEFQSPPSTLQERGYAPANVSGNPPVPINPFNPSKRLYSHP